LNTTYITLVHDPWPFDLQGWSLKTLAETGGTDWPSPSLTTCRT